jgi:AraC-like DNA-binding protein
MLSTIHMPLSISCADRASFRASIRSTNNLSGVHAFDVRGSAHIARRTDQILQTDDTRVYGVTLQVEGTSRISQDGSDAILGPGDFAIYDSTRPFEREFYSDYRALVLRFPQSMVSLPAHTLSQITAMRLSADEGLGRVVSPFLTGVVNNLGQINGWAGIRVAHIMVDLISSALAEKLNLDEEVRGGRRTSAFLQLCENIMDSLSDPQLSPYSIATANAISTRQLHKLFHAEKTTVSQWIRERRLEQCRRQLSDPNDNNLSVGEIAATWGIFDGAHFSRIFRNEFGMSPREYRRSCQLSAATPLDQTST